MPSTTVEITEIQRLLVQLRSNASALRAQYGDTPAVRRIHNDLERLDIDIAELSAILPAPRVSVESRQDVVIVPDTPYDPALWKDADDEGLGGRPPQ